MQAIFTPSPYVGGRMSPVMAWVETKFALEMMFRSVSCRGQRSVVFRNSMALYHSFHRSTA